MAKRGKHYRRVLGLVDRIRRYDLTAAVALVKEMHYVKFDEMLEVAFRLGVDPRKADQMVRGTVMLPHGVGKVPRIAVFAKGEKALEAEKAGADIIGAEDLIEKVRGGFFEFDRTLATPDIMGQVGKIGKILGPKGLMPNPKAGTVTFDIAKAVEEMKKGRLEFRVDKAGNVHLPVGRYSFAQTQLEENIKAAIDAIQRSRPSSAKGTYLRTLHVSGTMTPSVELDITGFRR
jgi:large subunit ribosomal protein L1